MQMVCPHCRGDLVEVNEQTARCPLHGGEYEILFKRQIAPPPVPSVPVSSGIGNDADLLPLAGEVSHVPPVRHGPPMPHCANHPDVEASVRCDACGIAVCQTCVFEFPGLKLCPTCVSKKPTMSKSRRKMMIAGYVMAAIPTILLALTFGGAFAEVADSPDGEAIFGVLFLLFGYAPTITGTCLSFSAADRRTGTSGAVWGAIIWNCIMLGIMLLLTIVGAVSE